MRGVEVGMRFGKLAAAAAGMAMALAAWGAAASEALPAPRGPVVLTVVGAPVTNGDGVASFDMEMLDALPQRSITTTSPWYKAPTRFDGPGLSDVLERVGAAGRAVSAHALNDYTVRIPAEDASRGLVLATRRDGERMSATDRGPIFAMYPFDADPGLKAQAFYSRCIWQLEELKVE